MAGKGTELGKTIDELKYIIDNIELKDKVGVCLDTCHLNDSGIDLNEFDKYLDEFDEKIGIDKIHCMHINDSKNVLGSHKDRHENIGLGTIGFDTLINVIYNPRLDNIPKILETPYVDKEYAPYKYEIEMIRNKTFNPNLYHDIINNK
jgi:deoxyribonuclease-4